MTNESTFQKWTIKFGELFDYELLLELQNYFKCTDSTTQLLTEKNV